MKNFVIAAWPLLGIMLAALAVAILVTLGNVYDITALIYIGAAMGFVLMMAAFIEVIRRRDRPI